MSDMNLDLSYAEAITLVTSFAIAGAGASEDRDFVRVKNRLADIMAHYRDHNPTEALRVLDSIEKKSPAEPHCDECGNDFPEDQLDPYSDGQRDMYLCVDCLEQALWGTSPQDAQDNKAQEVLDAGKDRNPHTH